MRQILKLATAAALVTFGISGGIMAQSRQEPVDLGIVSKIRDEEFNHSKVMETARYLADNIGARLTRSLPLKQVNIWTKRCSSHCT